MPRVTWAGLRDVLTFLGGLGLLGHETLAVTEPRVLLVGLAAAMIGVPATLTADRRFVRSIPTNEPPPSGRDGRAS